MKITEKVTKNNQSVTKLLTILEAMAAHGKPIRLKRLSELVGIPESTALRLLISLLENGYVIQNEESQYVLTYKIVRLANQYRSSFNIIEIARPFLKELSQKCQESVCLAIDQGGKVVHIDTVDGPNNILQTLQKVGKSVPLYCSGIGKNLLLNYSEERIRALYAAPDAFTPFTPHTIISVDDLLAELAQVRKQGYAYDREETELGACCIAAPIKDYSNRVIAGISVSGPALRMTAEKMEAIKSTILKVSNKIASALRLGDA